MRCAVHNAQAPPGNAPIANAEPHTAADYCRIVELSEPAQQLLDPHVLPPEYLDRLTAQSGTTREALLTKIRDWYNGYRFSKLETSVYRHWKVWKVA